MLHFILGYMFICAWMKENSPRIKIKMFTHCGLNSRMRPPPVSDHLSLTFWVVAYGSFDCMYAISSTAILMRWVWQCVIHPQHEKFWKCFFYVKKAQNEPTRNVVYQVHWLLTKMLLNSMLDWEVYPSKQAEKNTYRRQNHQSIRKKSKILWTIH